MDYKEQRKQYTLNALALVIKLLALVFFVGTLGFIVSILAGNRSLFMNGDNITTYRVVFAALVVLSVIYFAKGGTWSLLTKLF